MGRAGLAARLAHDREGSSSLGESVEVQPTAARSEGADTPGLGKEKVEKIQGDLLRYANERPPGWENLLFGHALVDALHSSPAKEASSFGAAPVLRSDALALSWCTEQLEEPKRFFSTVERLVNHDFAEARGPEGQPGNPEALVRVAREIASACLRAREWGA
jgi:hypothetical protein